MTTEHTPPTDEMIAAGAHALSEWLNDSAPIGESRYRLPAIAAFQAMTELMPEAAQPVQIFMADSAGTMALADAAAALAAAISLLEHTPKAKKAAASDKMFEQMLNDYRKTLGNARAARAARAAPRGRSPERCGMTTQNQFRVLVSPLTKTIYAGRVKVRDGCAESVGQRHDVTDDVLAAAIQYIGMGNTVTARVNGEAVCEISVCALPKEGAKLYAAPPAESAQPAPPYSIDADPLGIRAKTADAITGALAYGAQGGHRPPHGHWLTPFWEMARADATKKKTNDESDRWRKIVHHRVILSGASSLNGMPPPRGREEYERYVDQLPSIDSAVPQPDEKRACAAAQPAQQSEPVGEGEFLLRWHWYSDSEGSWTVIKEPHYGGLQEGDEITLVEKAKSAPQAAQAAPVDALPEKLTPAMLAAFRAGSHKDWPSDELCNVRYAALRAALAASKQGGNHGE